MVCTTIVLAAALLGTAFLLLPATEAAARAQVRMRAMADPNNKPKR
jgi:hypothetical protein